MGVSGGLLEVRAEGQKGREGGSRVVVGCL